MRHKSLEDMLYNATMDCESISQLVSELDAIRRTNAISPPATVHPPRDGVANRNAEVVGKSSPAREEVRSAGRPRRTETPASKPRTLGVHRCIDQPSFRFTPQLRRMCECVNDYPTMTGQLFVTRLICIQLAYAIFTV